MSIHVQVDGATVLLWVHVQPRARGTGVVGPHGDALKVRVTAPPEGGRANEALRRLLAGSLGVPASSVEIVSGHAARRKRVRVSGVTVEQVARLTG